MQGTSTASSENTHDLLVPERELSSKLDIYLSYEDFK
jgi:hypothetical protein